MITNVPRTGASSGQQRTRVLTGVQALRYSPTLLRSARALTLAPRTLVRFGMDDDVRSFASSTMAPRRVSIERVWIDQGRPPRVVRLDLAPDHATCRPDARVVVPNYVATRPSCRPDNDLRRPTSAAFVKLPWVTGWSIVGSTRRGYRWPATTWRGAMIAAASRWSRRPTQRPRHRGRKRPR